MDILGDTGLNTIATGLKPAAVSGAAQNVFTAFAGVIVAGVILTLSVYFIRKILNGANKGKARLR